MSDTYDFFAEADYDAGEDPSLDEYRRQQHSDRPDGGPKRIAYIRTSDRTGFKRCRRRWNWQSHLRQNLAPIEHASPLWTGTGFHFALEDFHGYRKYRHPAEAFKDFVRATRAQSKAIPYKRLPFDFLEQTKLAVGMLEYYADLWLLNRDPLKTFWYQGRPQVEVHALTPIPLSQRSLERVGLDEVWYASTFDRVAEDEFGDLWIVEYKTAKRIQTTHFQTDPQVGAYQWVGSQLYPNKRIAGTIYQQHLKLIPDEPRIVQGRPSTAKNQATTHSHYRHTLKKMYGMRDGAITHAPAECIEFLNYLASLEFPDRDRFVRRDRIERNQHQLEAEGTKILLELEDMLNLDIALYPNPTRECGHLCSFSSACISLDDGSDWEEELRLTMTTKDIDFDSWRKYLPQREAA